MNKNKRFDFTFLFSSIQRRNNEYNGNFEYTLSIVCTTHQNKTFALILYNVMGENVQF